MQKRYLPITILTGILFIIALSGYLVPAESEGPPVRVLLDNKAGKVIFTHKSHLENEDEDCTQCHHTSIGDTTPPHCNSCHVKKFDATFAANHQDEIDPKYCIACHHPIATIANFSHDAHVNDYVEKDCQMCHHDKSIEPEPQACSQCHHAEKDGDVPNLRDANHARCADCHDDFYEEGMEGCRHCHTRELIPAKGFEPQACSHCHKRPIDQLVPTTTTAFHKQCMSCHEEYDSGPFGDDTCYQCHMK